MFRNEADFEEYVVSVSTVVELDDENFVQRAKMEIKVIISQLNGQGFATIYDREEDEFKKSRVLI